MATSTDAKSEVLNGRHYAVLATHNDDGSIHLTPIWYLYETGTFYADSASLSRKVRNAVARADATIIVDIREPGCECWVSASGPVDILQGEESRSVNDHILRRYLTDEALADPRVGQAFAAAADVTLCLTPAVWSSWSLREMDDEFFGGLLGSTPDKWFQPVAA